MRTVALALVLLVVAVGLSLVQLALLPQDPQTLKARREAVLASIPSSEHRAVTREESQRHSDRLRALVQLHPSGTTLEIGPGIELSLTRALLAKHTLPVAAGLFSLGVLGGLLQRRRRAERLGFHSATFSHVGKVAALAGIVGYVVSGVAPVGLPMWSLYAFAALAAAGAVLYVGHLPPRL